MSAPDWLHDAVFYQIFPERFANGDPSNDPRGVVPWDSEPTPDNFFGGDLAGITGRLDHLTELGVNALYLTPIFKARTNHRYDAEDYFSIDPALGDEAAFTSLIDAAHERGIRVVLDAVLNHCGKTHPYFRDVVEREADSEYSDWYYIEDFPVVNAPTPNYRTCSGCEYLPKWNVHHPDVRRHHLSVAEYWIDRGIDGWRLDVPYFINMNFWRRFRQTVKAKGDDLYIVAEEWRKPEPWLAGDTADGTMNYTLRDLILGFTADRTVDAFSLVKGLNELRDRIPRGFHHGMLNLLGSHDTERLITRHGLDVDSELIAYDIMYACQGAPMLYYGDEVGMRGANDPGCRGGMIWDTAQWNTKILDHLRFLGRMRGRSIALRRGEQSLHAIDADTLVIMRCHAEEDLAVLVHRGPGTRVDFRELPSADSGSWTDTDSGELHEGGVTFQGAGSRFLKRGRGQ